MRTAWARLLEVLRVDTLAVASFGDVVAGEWAVAIERARRAIALAREPGEGMTAGADMPLAIALMVSDPDAADRVIDEGMEHIRRARSPAFPPASLASFKVGTALMRGDFAQAVELGRAYETVAGPRGDTLGLAYALHLMGDHACAEAEATRRQRVFRNGGEHSCHLLLALTAAATARWDDATHQRAEAAASVRRYR